MAITKTVGGGGEFKPELLSGTIHIASGTSGDVTVSCPSNKRLRLTLFCATSSAVSGVSLTIGSKSLASNATLDDGSNNAETAGRFGVGHGGGNAASGTRHPPVLADYNENIVFNFATTTTQNVAYAYEVGS